MQSHRFRRKLGGEVELDLCPGCQGIWFDTFESLQLAPESVIALFRLIHEYRDLPRQPLAAVMHCPRCGDALVHLRDLAKGGRFNYLRCEAHGRFTVFSQFLIEKGFVRQVSPAEIRQLKVELAQLRCSSCGAPVDVRTHSACPYCKAPVVVLDADALEKALAGFVRSGPPAVGGPRQAVRSAGQPAGQGQQSGLELIDLLQEGIGGLCEGLLP